MIKKNYQTSPKGDSKSGSYLILDEADDVNDPELPVIFLTTGAQLS